MLNIKLFLAVLLVIIATVEPKRFHGSFESSESKESWERKFENGDFNQSCIVKRWRTFCKDNLECQSNLCLCPSNSTWNGKYCDTFGMECSKNYQCKIQGLTCSNGICACPGDSVWDGQRCDFYNKSCVSSRVCKKQELRCTQTDSGNKCLCPAGEWNGIFCDTFNVSCKFRFTDKTCNRGLRCLSKSCQLDSLPYNARCQLSNKFYSNENDYDVDRCDSAANLECNGHRCVCKQGFSLTNGVCA